MPGEAKPLAEIYRRSRERKDPAGLPNLKLAMKSCREKILAISASEGKIAGIGNPVVRQICVLD